MGVSLSKGQRISLAKPGGGVLSLVFLGLGWDVAPGKGLFGRVRRESIDLDASCLLFDAGGRLVDQVWFAQLESADGSVLHTGDNLTGAGEGDDEVIRVDLPRVPEVVQSLVFTVNSFTGQSFQQVHNAFVRLVDESTGEELARYDLSAQGPHTAQIMAQIYREGPGWGMAAIGEIGSGRTFHDLLPLVVNHL
jgi:tellurium resistance protein TerZ